MDVEAQQDKVRRAYFGQDNLMRFGQGNFKHGNVSRDGLRQDNLRRVYITTRP